MIFVRVKKKPQELKADEYVVDAPNFLDDIKKCSVRRPTTNVMTVNYLRQVVSDIGQKYIGPEFNALTEVNVANFRGTPCSTYDEVHDVIQRIFKSKYPKMLDAYIEHSLKQRPTGTRVVYFLGSGAQCGAFLNLGFEEVLEKDLNKFLNKAKKLQEKSTPETE